MPPNRKHGHLAIAPLVLVAVAGCAAPSEGLNRPNPAAVSSEASTLKDFDWPSRMGPLPTLSPDAYAQYVQVLTAVTPRCNETPEQLVALMEEQAEKLNTTALRVLQGLDQWTASRVVAGLCAGEAGILLPPAE